MKEKLLKAIEQETPYHPDTDYEIGYHNGMTMAKAIIMKAFAEEEVDFDYEAEG